MAYVQAGLFGDAEEVVVPNDQLQNALEKIRDEMVSASNSYVQSIGQFLIKHLNAHPEDAEKVLADEKTIMKSLDEMRKEAEKHRVGNCAVLTDADGFAVVMHYFGIESKVGRRRS